MLQKWKSRQDKLNHDWAIVGWALSVSEDVREDVKERMTGGHRDAIERVITRMFQHPCHFKISGLDTTDMGAIIGTFWEEFKDLIEDWERLLLVTNDSVAEAKLLAKYKGLRFFLPDDEVVDTIFESNLEFQKGSKKKKISKGLECLWSTTQFR